MQSIFNYFSNIPRNKLIILIIKVLVLISLFVAAAFFFWNYFVIQKVVTLSPTANTNITIARQDSDKLDISQSIISTDSIQKIRLQPGKYVLRFTGTKDYQEELKSMTINKSVEIITPKLKYTPAKLDSLLNGQKSSIHKALEPIKPSPEYQIEAEKLFYTGEWYGVQMIPKDWYVTYSIADRTSKMLNDSISQDMLKIIMKKDNGKWEIVAGPSIIFSAHDYPNIPQDIIRTVNHLVTYPIN